MQKEIDIYSSVEGGGDQKYIVGSSKNLLIKS